MKKRKRCWFCAQEDVRKTFKNRTAMRNHIFECHPDEAAIRIASFKGVGQRGIPNVVHYGARMRKKLGLEYNKAGHLRSILEKAA